jgi:hypothetical protein
VAAWRAARRVQPRVRVRVRVRACVCICVRVCVWCAQKRRVMKVAAQSRELRRGVPARTRAQRAHTPWRTHLPWRRGHARVRWRRFRR